MDKILHESCMTVRTRNYGNYGIFLIIMGNTGFCPSTVSLFLNQCYIDPIKADSTMQFPEQISPFKLIDACT